MERGGFFMTKKILLITAGAFLTAFGTVYFAEPAGLVTGGVAGIAVIVRAVSGKMGFPIPLFLTASLINLPLLAAAVKIRGIKFTALSLYASVLYSIFLGALEYLPAINFDDILLSALLSGVLIGIGVGLTVKNGATTGGTDMFAELYKEKRPHVKTARVINITDNLIIFSGVFVFGAVKSFYAVLSVMAASFVISRILEGGIKAKGVLIFSNDPYKTAHFITDSLKRGATYLSVSGAYSGLGKTAVFSAVSEKELPTLTANIKRNDPEAFVIISDIKEIMGEF